MATAALGMTAGFAQSDPMPAEEAPSSVYRLTNEQYRNSIRDIFGRSVEVGSRFEPDQRVEGLIAIGTSFATVTPSAMELYNQSAKSIAAQVVDEERRAQLIPCVPEAIDRPDDACASMFLSKVGHAAFRRPLTDAELQSFVGVANDGTTQLGDFYEGLRLSLVGILNSPQFIFWREETEADPANPGHYRLTSESIARRLSFMLWNTTPDAQLLAAAETGDLHDREQLERQLDRMLASPRLETGVRAFFRDWLHFDEFEVLTKDSTLYPDFTRVAASQAQEQTLRTIVTKFVREEGDYRSLFTDRDTFMTPLLAALYRVPYEGSSSAANDWRRMSIPPEMPQAGLLTQASFLALHSHEGTSSPTLRGAAVREIFMCQHMPPPPPDVDFSQFEIADHGDVPTTARMRIGGHASNQACAGCHNMMDPLGFALENYDTAGGFRETENGLLIDASGRLNSVEFEDATGLGQAMAESDFVSSCLVQQLYSYSTGQALEREDRSWLRANIEPEFEEQGYQLRPLLRALLLNPEFYQVEAPEAEFASAR